MKVSLDYFKSILNTLPISYYLGRNIGFDISETAETSYYMPLEDKIVISYAGMESMFEQMETPYDLEMHIRSVLYHEVSHALLTPKDLIDPDNMFNQQLYNVFCDERIETINKDFFYGVDFKKNIVTMCNYKGDEPTNAWQAFFYLVRFRANKDKSLVNRVNEIIQRYWKLTATEYRSYDVDSYQVEIRRLFDDIAKQFYEEKSPEKLKEFDKNYDSKDEQGKSRSAGKLAEKEMMGDPEGQKKGTITTIIIRDRKSGSKANPKPSSSGGTPDTLIIETGGEPGDGESNPNLPSPTDNGEKSEEEKKKEKELEDLLAKIDENVKIIDERTKERMKQEMLDTTLNKFIDNSLTDNLGNLFQQFVKRTKRNMSATHGYSGILNPREIGVRKDWRCWTHKTTYGDIAGYDKVHLNLFIDTSGSFCGNQDRVNTILKSLDTLEKSYPFFEFDLVTCQVGEQLHPKDKRFVKCNGGNDLDDEIHGIFKGLQDNRSFNMNVILFDGDAFTDCWGKNHYHNFSAFNSNNCYIISDSDNEKYITKYAPQAYSIFVKGYRTNYSQMLYENIYKVLNKALQ